MKKNTCRLQNCERMVRSTSQKIIVRDARAWELETLLGDALHTCSLTSMGLSLGLYVYLSPPPTPSDPCPYPHALAAMCFLHYIL